MPTMKMQGINSWLQSFSDSNQHWVPIIKMQNLICNLNVSSRSQLKNLNSIHNINLIIANVPSTQYLHKIFLLQQYNAWKRILKVQKKFYNKDLSWQTVLQDTDPKSSRYNHLSHCSANSGIICRTSPSKYSWYCASVGS